MSDRRIRRESVVLLLGGITNRAGGSRVESSVTVTHLQEKSNVASSSGTHWVPLLLVELLGALAYVRARTGLGGLL